MKLKAVVVEFQRKEKEEDKKSQIYTIITLISNTNSIRHYLVTVTEVCWGLLKIYALYGRYLINRFSFYCLLHI